jgi:hypothetical protein
MSVQYTCRCTPVPQAVLQNPLSVQAFGHAWVTAMLYSASAAMTCPAAGHMIGPGTISDKFPFCDYKLFKVIFMVIVQKVTALWVYSLPNL